MCGQCVSTFYIFPCPREVDSPKKLASRHAPSNLQSLTFCPSFHPKLAQKPLGYVFVAFYFEFFVNFGLKKEKFRNRRFWVMPTLVLPAGNLASGSILTNFLFLEAGHTPYLPIWLKLTTQGGCSRINHKMHENVHWFLIFCGFT